MREELPPNAVLPIEWRVAHPLGMSQVAVPRLAVGLRAISRDAGANHRMLLRAHSLGFRHFDAAPSYGFGSVETQLGQAADALGRGDLVLSTKVGRMLRRPSRVRDAVHRLSHLTLDDAPVAQARRVARRLGTIAGVTADGSPGATSRPSRPPGRARGPGATDLAAVCDYSYDGVMRSFEASLARLGTDRIEIVYLHDPVVHVAQASRHGYRALEGLRRAGAIGAIGASMNDGAMLARFIESVDLDVVLLAGRYTLLDQSGHDTLFDAVTRRGIGLVVGGVFNGGLLADPEATHAYNWGPAPAGMRARARSVHSVCSAHGVDARAAALRFTLAHPAISTVLLGPESESQLEASVRWLAADIPTALWHDLRREGLLREDVPVPTAGPSGAPERD